MQGKYSREKSCLIYHENTYVWKLRIEFPTILSPVELYVGHRDPAHSLSWKWNLRRISQALYLSLYREYAWLAKKRQ